MISAPLLNTNDTLDRLGGDKKLCGQLFQEFIRLYEGFAVELQALIDHQAWHEASEATHRLKGIALNVGAEQLAACATTLETELKEHQQATALTTLLELLPPTFAVLQENADHLLAEANSMNIDGHLSANEIKEQLAEAKSWFDTDYGKALKLIEQLAAQCPEAKHPEIHQLSELMKRFNIISARKALHQLVLSSSQETNL